jgi:hypothetical protein
MSDTQPAQNEEASVRPRRRRHWLWSVLIGAAILICGIIIGVCLTLVVVRNRVIDLIQHPRKRTAAMVRRLDGALNLSEQQRKEVRAVLERHRAEFERIRRDVHPRIRTQIESLDHDISAVLDEEQKRKWERYLTRLRRLWLPRFRGGKNEEGASGRAVP